MDGDAADEGGTRKKGLDHIHRLTHAPAQAEQCIRNRPMAIIFRRSSAMPQSGFSGHRFVWTCAPVHSRLYPATAHVTHTARSPGLGRHGV